uniref:Uncharacterized protein n=1 Tax=Cacopsylla melanoneura TaxID=428564 RepID=A0A8D8QQB1_9HEMI
MVRHVAIAVHNNSLVPTLPFRFASIILLKIVDITWFAYFILFISIISVTFSIEFFTFIIAAVVIFTLHSSSVYFLSVSIFLFSSFTFNFCFAQARPRRIFT